MDFGMPAAVGAKDAAPHETFIDIGGDANANMTAMELQTASRFGIGVKVFVLDDKFSDAKVSFICTHLVFRFVTDFLPFFFVVLDLSQHQILPHCDDEFRFSSPRPSYGWCETFEEPPKHRDNNPVLWSFVEASEDVFPAFYRHLFGGAYTAVLGSRWKGST
jgi:hypothetical protein